jgi:hypothetical protein
LPEGHTSPKTFSEVLGSFGGTPVEYTTDYYWVVICKNHRVHHKGNTSYEHHIRLGETDAYSPPPMLTEKITVRCDSCGEEYSYKPKEVTRA